MKAGASQEACEDALLEASIYGEAEAVQLLICSDMPRPDAAAHAPVMASSRGFVDVVTTLIKVQQIFISFLFFFELNVFSVCILCLPFF